MKGRALLLAGMILFAPQAAQAALPCPMPTDFAEGARPMFSVAEAAAQGRLRVLVLGSASVTGPGASAAEASWPARLEAMLAARHPNVAIEIIVRGGRGVSVQDHLALLRNEAGSAAPALVIWQLGTVEATRGMDPEEMTEALRLGLDLIRRRGADAMVVEPQFSRFLRANANVEPYREKLRLTAAAAGAVLFRRWDIMQHWIENGGPDLERTPREQRSLTTDRLNECLALGMAELVALGVAEARQGAQR